MPATRAASIRSSPSQTNRPCLSRWRRDPPELIRGDYVAELPALLRDRIEGAQLVVFQTASTMYLDRPGAERLRAALRAAGQHEPLVFVTTGRAPDDDGFALEVERFPKGRPRRVAVFDFHGAWLDWGR